MGWPSPLWGSSWGMPGHRKAVWGGESVICFDRKVRRLQTTSWSHENERIEDTQNTAKLGLGYIMAYRWATQTHPSKIKMNLTFGISSTARVWEQTVCLLKYMHAHVHRLEQWTFHFFFLNGPFIPVSRDIDATSNILLFVYKQKNNLQRSIYHSKLVNMRNSLKSASLGAVTKLFIFRHIVVCV